MARRRKKKSVDAAGISLIVVVIIVIISLIGFGLFLAFNTKRSVELDVQTLCPKAGPTHTVSVLLDITDGISDATRLAIENNLADERERLKRYGKLAFYTVNESGLSQLPISLVCNPGDLDDLNDEKWDEFLIKEGLTGSPSLIKRQNEFFDRKINKNIGKLLDQDFQAPQSPLLSALQEISLIVPDTQSVGDSRGDYKNKIIFITDMLEHTDYFSVYRSGLDRNAFLESRAPNKYSANLEDFDVHMWFIKRNRFNTGEVRKFWFAILSKVMNVNFPEETLGEQLLVLPGETDG